MAARTLARTISAVAATDGAGVRLLRSLGSSENARLDPFLSLAEFGSDDPEGYVAGFPAHPHRGFETCTYMLEGQLLHEDHLGNRGLLGPGGVQWMTAGRGVIHSEMPQQERGRLRGFQLWINLPAREKLKPASYRDIPAAGIPAAALPAGGRVKVIAGDAVAGETTFAGPVQGLATEPLLIDVELPPGARFAHPLPPGHSAFLYPYEGSLIIGAAGTALAAHCAGFLSAGDTIELTAGAHGARFLLGAGRPLGEPVVQYGPFVMNTAAEIEQAIQDYRSGALTGAA